MHVSLHVLVRVKYGLPRRFLDSLYLATMGSLKACCVQDGCRMLCMILNVKDATQVVPLTGVESSAASTKPCTLTRGGQTGSLHECLLGATRGHVCVRSRSGGWFAPLALHAVLAATMQQSSNGCLALLK